MKINFINKNKIKKHTFIICIGIMLGTKIISFNQSTSTTEITNNKPVNEMSIEEKLETRGGVHIYFKNKEYMLQEKDSIAFFTSDGKGQGVVESKHDDYIITFVPGNTYNFYIKSLNTYGEIEINEIGKVINLIIDYKNMNYEITNEDYHIEKNR